MIALMRCDLPKKEPDACPTCEAISASARRRRQHLLKSRCVLHWRGHDERGAPRRVVRRRGLRGPPSAPTRVSTPLPAPRPRHHCARTHRVSLRLPVRLLRLPVRGLAVRLSRRRVSSGLGTSRRRTRAARMSHLRRRITRLVPGRRRIARLVSDRGLLVRRAVALARVERS